MHYVYFFSTLIPKTRALFFEVYKCFRVIISRPESKHDILFIANCEVLRVANQTQQTIKENMTN